MIALLPGGDAGALTAGMIDHTMVSERPPQECTAAQQFLESPSQDTFAAVFTIFTPQLTSFFRARGCGQALSEDLAQEVMLIVYRKADQLRDRNLFRAWLFKVARSSLCRYYGKRSREVETIDLEKVADHLVASTNVPAATPAFEFLHWMSFLDTREQEALKLRFIEEWEYHEIASAKAIPIGTVQWRVFNAKKKLAPILRRRASQDRRAA
jgi:RNA polymerase sigma-70 factor (ECF subfamily)